MKKKIISLFLVTFLVLSTTTNAFAVSRVDEKSQNNRDIYSKQNEIKLLDIKKYDKDAIKIMILALDKYGYSVSSVSKSMGGDLILHLQNGKIQSTVRIKKASSEEIVMISEEGKISNNVVIRDNGDIFVDGVLASDNQAPKAGKEVKADAFQDRYQIACPYGMSQDYSKYNRTIRNADVKFWNSAKNITTLILAVLIGRIIPGFDLLFGLSYEIAGLIKKYDPYSSAASFVMTEYFHKKGYFVNNMIAVKKCYATIYTEADYEGFSFSRNFYFVHEFDM